MSRALHMRRDRQAGEGLDLRVSLCGMLAVDMAGSVVEVTCRLCRRALAETPAQSDEPEALGEERQVERGSHALTSAGRRAIERSRRGEDVEGPRWRSLSAAYRQWARIVDDGASVRSSSDPGRFGHRSQPSSGGAVRSPSGRDDLVGLELAEQRATAAAFDVGRVASPDVQRRMMALRFAGKPVRSPTAGRKASVVQRVPQTLEDIAELLGDGWTERQVSLVLRRVTRAMVEDLVSRGVLEAGELRRGGREKGGETMRIPGYDLDGWKEIVAVLGCSISAARSYARDEGLPVLPLPNGKVAARKAELEAWALAWARKGRAA